MNNPKLADYLKAHPDVRLERYTNRNGDRAVLHCTMKDGLPFYSVTTAPGLSGLYNGISLEQALESFEKGGI